MHWKERLYHKRCLLAAAIGVLPLLAFGQMDLLYQSEQSWSKAFTQFGTPFAYEDWEDYELVRDSLKQKLVALLDLDPNFKHRFDSLDQHIAVLQSPDQRLRICSWDEHSGGSMHDMATLAQFIDEEGNPHYTWLDPEIVEEGQTDALYSRLYQLQDEAGQACYLLIGWGTYGSGHHHYSARLLRISGHTLTDVPAAFGDKDFLEVSAPRSMRVEMEFTPESQALTHREFVMNQEMGFMENTGRWVVWIYDSGRFVRQ
ncbi:MAG: hypothetical protein AAFV07_21270 [Bacteroidota bacterium]